MTKASHYRISILGIITDQINENFQGMGGISSLNLFAKWVLLTIFGGNVFESQELNW